MTNSRNNIFIPFTNIFIILPLKILETQDTTSSTLFSQKHNTGIAIVVIIFTFNLILFILHEPINGVVNGHGPDSDDSFVSGEEESERSRPILVNPNAVKSSVVEEESMVAPILMVVDVDDVDGFEYVKIMIDGGIDECGGAGGGEYVCGCGVENKFRIHSSGKLIWDFCGF